MGYGWELQAGALLVAENGEFRFRDKIKLTDEGGSVTDTYTFDAYANLSNSTRDTENIYLYRGGQYDSFTGLYYLRARYMNPSTGTFITMDEYAGSVFEPVSLHKYLYANANPVMNSDPSGYETLHGQMTTMAGLAVLYGMVIATYAVGVSLLNSLNTSINPTSIFNSNDILDWNLGIASGATTSLDIDLGIKYKNSDNIPYIHTDSPSCDSNITFAKSDDRANSRTKFPPARRVRCKSKKEAYEKAKKAGKGREPIHHPDDPEWSSLSSRCTQFTA